MRSLALAPVCSLSLSSRSTQLHKCFSNLSDRLKMTQPASSTSYHPSGSLRSRVNSALSGLSDQLGSKLPEINSIQHTIRQQVVMHSPSQAAETLKLQLAITAGAA